MKQIQQQIVDTIVQFYVHNGENMTHQEIEAGMTSRRNAIVKRSIIHDGPSLQKNLDLSCNLIQEWTLDKNKPNYV
jgi:hypothetical protein